MTRSVRAGSNKILDGLPAGDRQRLAAVSEHVALLPGDVLCVAGRALRDVYFPSAGVISLYAATASGPDVGVGTIGAAGMLGLNVAAGRTASTMSAAVQVHGSAERIHVGAFRELLDASAGLRYAMLGYGHDLSAQLAQNIFCLSCHPARRRLARWMIDLTPGSKTGQFSSTQAATALALGVRRPAVSRAAGALKQLGLIRYLRGEVSILDRAGLVEVACACSRSPRLFGKRSR